MTPFSFMTATQIRFGRGASAEALPDIARHGRRVLLVHGATIGRSRWFAEKLAGSGCEIADFAVAHEPDTDLVEAGVAKARSANADFVCAFGGGAVIDAGKAIAALAPAIRPMLDHLEVVGKGLPLDQPPLPFIAIPTTSGTGAEVTRNSVIGVREHRRKVSLRDPRMLPVLAVVDPALTDECPRSVTLASGLDAITQVIEPYVCSRSNAMTDALCSDAIPRGLAALRILMREDDPAARDEMAWVSLCGGLALANAGLGAVHGLAGPLGGLTGAAHGALCGALLPHVLKANADKVTDPVITRRFREIAGWIANAFEMSPDMPLAEAAAMLAEWSGETGLPGLSQLGVDGDVRSAAAQAAATSSSMKANPVTLSDGDLVRIMEQAG